MKKKREEQLPGLTMPPPMVPTTVASIVPPSLFPSDWGTLMSAPLLGPSPLPTPLVHLPVALVLYGVPLKTSLLRGTTGPFVGLPLALFRFRVELLRLPL